MADLAFPSAPGGDVSIDLIGDKALLMPYIFDARREMAQFKAYYGIDEKRAAGEWVGFHHAEKRYPSGVRIELVSNGTQDSIRLYGAVQAGGAEEAREEEEERKQPYLWVGARIMYEKLTDPVAGVPWNGFSLMVIEPDQNGMVMSDWIGWGPGSHDHTYIRETQDSQYLPLDLTVQDQVYTETWPWVPPDRRQYVAMDWQINPGRTISDMGKIRFTRHGLRHYDINDTNAEPTPEALAAGIVSWIHAPYDPLATDKDLEERVFPDGYGYPKTVWDQVVVLDPYEGQIEPTSYRDGDAETLDAIEKVTGISGDTEVIPGEYIIKVAAFGTECNWSNVPAPYNYGWNEDVVNYLEPLPIEIEVRVGKYPDTVTQRFQITIDRYSDAVRKIWPFGDHTVDVSGCQQFTRGDNPHGSNWWQGAILADPTQLTIAQYEPFVPDIFGDAQEYWNCGHTQPWDIYVQIFQPWCAYAEHSYADEAGHQTFWLLNNARKGIYGQLSIPTRTEQQVKNAALLVINQDTGEGLYKYDPDKNKFQAVSVPPDDPGLTYDTSSYETWEYTYRWQSLLQCRGFAKVRLGRGDPVFAGFTFPQDPANVRNANCCIGYNTSP